MNWGLSPLALSIPVPFFGHSKGIPMTTGTEDPPDAKGGDTGRIEPLATKLIDAGLVMDTGTVTGLAPLRAAEPEGRISIPTEAEARAPEPNALAVTLRPTATVPVAVMVLVWYIVSTRNTLFPTVTC